MTSRKKIHYSILLMAFVLRIFIIYESAIHNTFMGIIPDDSFYYLTIARNIANGLGSTFDQSFPTNGYHPLWMMLILPIMTLRISEELSVYCVMILGAFIWCAGSIPLQKITRSLYISEQARIGMLLFYLFAPFNVYNSVNCLETSLVVYAFLLFGCFFTGLTSKKKIYNWRFFVKYGFVCGIFFLSRTDSAIIIAIMSLALAIILITQKCKYKIISGFFLAGITGLIVILPWLIWNLKTFGSIMQTSGTALTYFAKDSASRIELLTSFDLISRSLEYFIGTFGSLLCFSITLSEARHDVAGALIFFLIFTSIYIQSRGDTNHNESKLLVIACLTSYLVYFFAHAAIRWSVREWYYAIPCLLIYSCLIKMAEYKLPKYSIVIAFAAVSVMWPSYYFGIGNKGGIYYNQITNRNWTDIRSFDESIPESIIVGHSDSGIAGFLMKRKVINLDGLVNSQILSFYKTGKGDQYITTNNVQYVYTREPYSNPLYSGPLKLMLRKPDHRLWHFQKVLKEREIAEYHFPKGAVAIGDVDASKYLGIGWSIIRPQDSDVWSIGEKSSLFLPLHSGADYLLNLNIMKYPPIRNQLVSIHLNGHKVAEIEALDHWSNHEVALPKENINEGVNLLDLTYSNNAKPSSMSDSRDNRPIAVNLKGFFIQQCHDSCKPF